MFREAPSGAGGVVRRARAVRASLGAQTHERRRRSVTPLRLVSGAAGKRASPPILLSGATQVSQGGSWKRLHQDRSLTPSVSAEVQRQRPGRTFVSARPKCATPAGHASSAQRDACHAGLLLCNPTRTHALLNAQFAGGMLLKHSIRPKHARARSHAQGVLPDGRTRPRKSTHMPKRSGLAY